LQGNNNLNEGNLTQKQGSITSKAELLEFPKNQEFFENPLSLSQKQIKMRSE